MGHLLCSVLKGGQSFQHTPPSLCLACNLITPAAAVHHRRLLTNLIPYPCAVANSFIIRHPNQTLTSTRIPYHYTRVGELLICLRTSCGLDKDLPDLRNLVRGVGLGPEKKTGIQIRHIVVRTVGRNQLRFTYLPLELPSEPRN